MKDYDVIIIGAGAAGLMCAIAAGHRGRSVLILEGSNKIGKKVLMSGGGRCNFTNLYCEPDRFLSANQNFCISALSRYTPADFISQVEQHGIQFHEKTAGQLFCDDSSKQIVKMLADDCNSLGVEILTQCKINTVEHQEHYLVSCEAGRFVAESLVIATGGLSIPKMGASGFGYRVARQFNLNVLETRAGLVPFTFTGAMQEITDRLSGVSHRVELSTANISFTENVLFTHRGLSGPAALQLSSYWAPGEEISLDLFPEHDAQALLSQAKRLQPRVLLRSMLSEWLPRALVLEFQDLYWSGTADQPLAEYSDITLKSIASHLQHWVLRPAATEGYRTAEVTLGGIDTNELSSKTMESKRHPGLYFIGEVVDVTGHLGGFNFQWAWASGHAAGTVV